jgi:hypothetical protein
MTPDIMTGLPGHVDPDLDTDARPAPEPARPLPVSNTIGNTHG